MKIFYFSYMWLLICSQNCKNKSFKDQVYMVCHTAEFDIQYVYPLVNGLENGESQQNPQCVCYNWGWFGCQKEKPTQVHWVTAAAAAAKSLQSCLTLCDPIDGSPPGLPSLGFSRQEHWSGLPFPSPMHESEK